MAQVNTFAGSPLDRAGHERDDGDWLAAHRAAPDTRFLPLWQLRGLMRPGAELAISWRGAAEIAPFAEAGATEVFLGILDGVAHFAIDVSAAGEHKADAPFQADGKWIDVRSAAMSAAGDQAAILAQSRSMIDWHARHRFCAECGQPSELRDAGYMRKCGGCGASHFPRTDPVTIMLVLDGAGNCMLGRQPRFPKGSYSALAGFVEPGETIEEAVRREVREEAGLIVGEVRYVSSQPWPFPSSLMIGCWGQAETTEITLDQRELEDARWFARAEIARMVENWSDLQEIRMPPPLSIAHQLARQWLKETA